MQYEVTQIISYLVTAETPDEALVKAANHPKVGTAPWQDEGIELYDERLEVNG
jgi:hypothetical protein